MKKIIYYAASSIDGYISGVDDDVSGFIHSGKGVEKYFEDLRVYKTVIMGRSTYEIGYKYGALPGQPSPAYPHMKHYIFSDSSKFAERSEQVAVKKLDITEITRLKETSETDIYLCGGGKFAGWLLENGQIDILKIKLNPIILGTGTKLFENIRSMYQLELIESKIYDKGLQIMTFSLKEIN